MGGGEVSSVLVKSTESTPTKTSAPWKWGAGAGLAAFAGVGLTFDSIGNLVTGNVGKATIQLAAAVVAGAASVGLGVKAVAVHFNKDINTKGWWKKAKSLPLGEAAKHLINGRFQEGGTLLKMHLIRP